MSTVLGGPYNGYSGKQTITSKRDNEGVMTRRILRSSWNTPQAATQTEITSPFKAINNLDNNRKFVSDSSDYVRFKKQQAMNRNYNGSKH